MNNVICEFCRISFHKKPSHIKKHNFCCIDHYNKSDFLKSHIKKVGFKKYHKEFRTKEGIEKMAASLRGRIKDNPGYGAIHRWISSKLGKANSCVVCKKSDKGRQYEWSNKDHKYRLDLNDYKMMCQSCHIQYDKKFNKKFMKK